MTSLRVCVLQIAMYDALSASNTTGSFQKSEPMQLGIPNGPFWNKSHEPNQIKARDMRHMTGLLAEDLRVEAKAWCLQNSIVKRIRISADSNDIDCSNIIHVYIIKSVDVNRTAIAHAVHWYCNEYNSQPDEGLYT